MIYRELHKSGLLWHDTYCCKIEASDNSAWHFDSYLHFVTGDVKQLSSPSYFRRISHYFRSPLALFTFSSSISLRWFCSLLLRFPPTRSNPCHYSNGSRSRSRRSDSGLFRHHHIVPIIFYPVVYFTSVNPESPSDYFTLLVKCAGGRLGPTCLHAGLPSSFSFLPQNKHAFHALFS